MGSLSKTLLAISLQQEGRFDDAEAILRDQLREFPNDVAALYSMGVLLNQRAEPQRALGLMKRALLVKPDFQLAATAIEQLEASLKSSVKADTGRLNVTREEHRVAISLQGLGKLSEARAMYEKILEDDPQDFIALYSMGVLVAGDGDVNDAIRWFEKAEQVRDDFSPLHSNKATLLGRVGLLDEALAAFDRAITLRPENLDASLNRAALLQMMGQDFDAVQGLLQALTFSPDDPKLLCNAAVGLTTLEQHALALPYFNRLMQINPAYDYAAGYRLFSEMHVCDWAHFHEHREEVIDGVAQGRHVINPLAFCAINDDPTLQLRCAQLFAQHRYPVRTPALWQGEKYRHRKLRVGYLSPDFREHPVGHLIVGVIEQHNKTRVESFAFSMGKDDLSSLRKRFKFGFDHFLECRDKTSFEIGNLIRATEIDVLVDLAGFTAGSRAEILAMRPAPVHINYLGYPSTMGAHWMDYIVADNVVIPTKLEPFYQERVLRLPFCYLPIDDSLKPAREKPSRIDHGLPPGALVFCSFNHDYKISPSVWKIWMDLLGQHGESVLWLMKLNEHATHNLRASAAKAGIDPSRIIFASRTPLIEDHLARYQLADVFLDTNPYNAHSTATDALRIGLPIVTLPGKTFASRVAASVIEHTGDAHSRKAKSAQDYSDLAAAVAKLRHSTPDRTRDAPTRANFPSSREVAGALEDLFIGLEPR